MPSQSEGWGGAEREPDRAKPQNTVQRRTVPINKERFAGVIRWLRIFEQTTPALRATS